jgi:hypothetical protein
MNLIEIIGSLSTLVQVSEQFLDQLKGLRRRLRGIFTRMPGVDYENDFIDEVVDIRDRTGATAVLEKRQQVRFRRSESAILRDGVWGEGEQLSRYSVVGARQIGMRHEGLRKTVLLAVEPRPVDGEAQEVRITRTMRHAFLEPTGFFDLMAERPTKRLSLKVLFPRSRPPRQAHLVEWPAERTMRRVPVRYAPDRRPFLYWKEMRPHPLTAYSLRWMW